ncbi:MAG: hypothetical protein ABIQ73_28475 [Acidimicrobiales bacterium]
MPTADDVRLVALNIGVRSKEELDMATAFWEAVLETRLEEHYPPTEGEEQPRHALIHDPVGNRAVIWQR